MSLLLQLFLELLLKLLVIVASELAFIPFGSLERDLSKKYPFLLTVVCAAYGTALGLIGLAIYPHHIIHNHWARLLNLFLTPVLFGLLMERRSKRKAASDAIDKSLQRFSRVFALLFFFMLVRLMKAE